MRTPLLILAALGALGLLAAVLVYVQLWAGSGPKPGPHTVIVEEGSSLSRVADQLADMGAIPGSAGTFKAMARIFGSSDPVQAGEFLIPAGTSGAKVLDILQHGQPIQRLVTVPEGMPSILVYENLMAQPLLTGAIRVPEEGSILPDSYSYQRGESRAAVLKRMQGAMTKELDTLWARRKPSAAVKSKREAVILASVVEKETGKASERRMVAGVLSNRLRIGMMLGADATTIYPITKGKPLGRLIRVSELRDPNPYNTRAIAGLPAGPITNPGREAIAAVLDPAQTGALYYVADGTGGHVFSRTLEEHNANAARWRAQRRAKGEM